MCPALVNVFNVWMYGARGHKVATSQQLATMRDICWRRGDRCRSTNACTGGVAAIFMLYINQYIFAVRASLVGILKTHPFVCRERHKTMVSIDRYLWVAPSTLPAAGYGLFLDLRGINRSSTQPMIMTGFISNNRVADDGPTATCLDNTQSSYASPASAADNRGGAELVLPEWTGSRHKSATNAATPFGGEVLPTDLELARQHAKLQLAYASTIDPETHTASYMVARRDNTVPISNIAFFANSKEHGDMHLLKTSQAQAACGIDVRPGATWNQLIVDSSQVVRELDRGSLVAELFLEMPPRVQRLRPKVDDRTSAIRRFKRPHHQAPPPITTGVPICPAGMRDAYLQLLERTWRPADPYPLYPAVRECRSTRHACRHTVVDALVSTAAFTPTQACLMVISPIVDTVSLYAAISSIPNLAEIYWIVTTPEDLTNCILLPESGFTVGLDRTTDRLFTKREWFASRQDMQTVLDIFSITRHPRLRVVAGGTEDVDIPHPNTVNIVMADLRTCWRTRSTRPRATYLIVNEGAVCCQPLILRSQHDELCNRPTRETSNVGPLSPVLANETAALVTDDMIKDRTLQLIDAVGPSCVASAVQLIFDRADPLLVPSEEADRVHRIFVETFVPNIVRKHQKILILGGDPMHRQEAQSEALMWFPDYQIATDDDDPAAAGVEACCVQIHWDAGYLLTENTRRWHEAWLMTKDAPHTYAAGDAIVYGLWRASADDPWPALSQTDGTCPPLKQRTPPDDTVRFDGAVSADRREFGDIFDGVFKSNIYCPVVVCPVQDPIGLGVFVLDTVRSHSRIGEFWPPVVKFVPTDRALEQYIIPLQGQPKRGCRPPTDAVLSGTAAAHDLVLDDVPFMINDSKGRRNKKNNVTLSCLSNGKIIVEAGSSDIPSGTEICYPYGVRYWAPEPHLPKRQRR